MAQTEQPRSLIRLSGADAPHFIKNLITNDPVQGALRYAALLSPQGKYIADFFVFFKDDAIVLDVASPLCDLLMARLNMYRLRADVRIEPLDMPINCGVGPTPEGAYADPRDSKGKMGWRQYGITPSGAYEWTALRVKHLIPETGIELTQDTYILEAGFERLNGVDFKKGCYVGQEVTARMKHKTELRKGLAHVKIDQNVPIGTQIRADGKDVGTIFSQSTGRAIAFLRFDRVRPQMQAGGANVLLK